MYFITTKRMLEVCFSAHPNIQYRTFCYLPSCPDYFYNMLDKDNCIMYSYSKNCNKCDYTTKEKNDDREDESI